MVAKALVTRFRGFWRLVMAGFTLLGLPFMSRHGPVVHVVSLSES